jgi:hypothetical protein
MKPEFITFTGADDLTDVWEMTALGLEYPIEWGVLFSAKRQGADPRYPGRTTIDAFAWNCLRMSAHICGDYSDQIMRGESVLDGIATDLGHFSRIQVNHVQPDPASIVAFGSGWGSMRCIAQARDDAFPINDTVDWLFDRSGGRGTVPAAWPAHPGRGRMVGYAGGISPDNVADVVKAIGSTGPYWIDMESGVRTDNRFDLAKCRQVCEIVFGKAP